MSSTSGRVVIGMDPHKRSATIEVMSADEVIQGGGRFGTDRDGYAAMVGYGKRWPDRVWARADGRTCPSRVAVSVFRCADGVHAERLGSA